MNDREKTMSSERDPADLRDWWIMILLGFVCYPVPYLYMTFPHVIEAVSRPFLDAFGRARVLGGLLLIPGFGLFVVFPCVLGQILFLSVGSFLLRTRRVVGNAVLGGLFGLGLILPFSQDTWVPLDLASVGAFAANSFCLPFLGVPGLLLFICIFGAVLSSWPLLFWIFDYSALLYFAVVVILEVFQVEHAVR